MTLEANEYYQVAGWHGEYAYSDHATVSVEFEKTGTTGHHHATKETQLLEVVNEITYERFNITVKNAHGGKYTMVFVNPNYNPDDKNSPRTVTTRELKDNADASTVRNALQDYYNHWKVWSSQVEVFKYETNDAGETVTDGAT